MVVGYVGFDDFGIRCWKCCGVMCVMDEFCCMFDYVVVFVCLICFDFVSGGYFKVFFGVWFCFYFGYFYFFLWVCGLCDLVCYMVGCMGWVCCIGWVVKFGKINLILI